MSVFLGVLLRRERIDEVIIVEQLKMLPVKKTSKSKTRSRRSHHRLTAVNYSVCRKCDQAKLPHAACSNCGYVNPRITLKLGKES